MRRWDPEKGTGTARKALDKQCVSPACLCLLTCELEIMRPNLFEGPVPETKEVLHVKHTQGNPVEHTVTHHLATPSLASLNICSQGQLVLSFSTLLPSLGNPA
jgi:hypothetical protein